MAPFYSSRRFLKISLDRLAKDQIKPPSAFPWHRFPLSRLFKYGFLVLIAFRFLFLAYSLTDAHQSKVYFTFDPTMSLYARLFSHQPLLALAFVLSAIFIFSEDYLFFARPNAFYSSIADELFNQNGAQFWSLNQPHLKLSSVKWNRHFLQSILAIKDQLSIIWNYQSAKFTQKQLPTFPILSSKERTRIILYEILWSETEFWILFETGFLMSLPPILSLLSLFSILSPFQFALTSLDLLIIYLIDFQLFRHLLFHLINMLLMFYASGCTFNRLTKNISSIWKQLKAGRHQEGAIKQQLAFYQTYHWRLLHTVLSYNSAIVSSFQFLLFLTNFPIAICLQAILLQPGVSPQNALTMFIFEIIHICFTFLTITQLYGLWTTAYRSPPYLNLIQPYLVGSKNIRAKLKLLAYYEQLHSRKKYAFTVGPIGKITKKSFVSLLLLDFAYVLNTSIIFMNK